MNNISVNNRRIAKNTLLLYVRMLLMMFVQLYTSRVILNALGVTDFGIYNAVGGFVLMFSVLSGSLSAAISRFITFELGRGNKNKLERIFSSALMIQFFIGLIIVLLIETLGIWFLNAKMSIPDNRMAAANWVLQFSLLTFVVNLISVPYNACIIAHERMSAFAYIGLLEAVCKLLVALFIVFSPFDKLIYYGILMFLVALIIRSVYGIYCKRHFEECHFNWSWDKRLFREIFGFAGWNFIGSSSGVLRDQGVNMLINVFCGPAVNAARGIAMQVCAAVNSFSLNFMTALNPQITKLYAQGDRKYLFILVCQGARLTFYLLLLLSMPILMETNYILMLWLKIVPEHAVVFVQLVLVYIMCESISNPLVTLMLATGKIRNYQILVGGCQMLNFPIAYLFLKLGFSPEITFVISIIIAFLTLSARLYMLRKMVQLPVHFFIKNVVLNVLMVGLCSSIIPFFLAYNLEENFASFLCVTFVSLFSVLIMVYLIGCTQRERIMVKQKVGVLINKLKN